MGTPELYNALEVTPFKLTGGDNTYIHPEAMRMVLQLEMSDKSGLVFRGEAMMAKEIDEISALLSGTAKALAEFPPDQAPAAFRDLAPSWPERLVALQKKPELIPASALHQEIRAAQWARSLPAAAAAQPVLLFPTYPFTEIWYDFLPEPSTVGTPVTLQAMRGEYAPACVNVLPMDASRNLLVSVGDLKGPDGAVLPASAFDLRVLKAWYRNGSGGFQDPTGAGVWNNELLLKDDSIISSDPVKKRNTIHSTKDAATLQPVKIDRFMTRQFWLTAHIPVQQAPGLYAGQVQVTSGGKEMGSIPLQVRVLPLTLEKGKFNFGIYYQSHLGVNEQEDRWYEADMKSMAEHGFTNVTVIEGAKDKHLGNGSVLEYDLSLVRRALEMRKKYGLTGKTAMMGGIWDSPGTDKIYRDSAQELLASPADRHNWSLLAHDFDGLIKELGFEGGYMYALDEPGYDATGKAMKRETILSTWAKEDGFKATSAITLPAAESVKDVLALPIIDSPAAVIGPDRRKLPFDEAWVYWHPSRDPTSDRLMSGLFLWYGGFTGVIPYPFKWDIHEWNDWFKSKLGYALVNYVFPGEDGPVPTREYEGLRAGFNDVKYLEMLNNRVKALANRQDKLDTNAKAAWKEAEQLLNHAPALFQGDPIPVSKRVDGKVLGEFRAHVADLLLKLDAAVRAHGGTQ